MAWTLALWAGEKWACTYSLPTPSPSAPLSAAIVCCQRGSGATAPASAVPRKAKRASRKAAGSTAAVASSRRSAEYSFQSASGTVLYSAAVARAASGWVLLMMSTWPSAAPARNARQSMPGATAASWAGESGWYMRLTSPSSSRFQWVCASLVSRAITRSLAAAGSGMPASVARRAR